MISLRKTFFSRYTYTCMAGVSGRVTQDPIFTCEKNLSTDNVSQESKLKFIKLIIYWTLHIIGTHATQGPAAFRTSTSPWPEWISTHQCTSWPFCPLDGLHFFIGRRMGFMTVHFFLLLTIVLFFFLVPARFSLDLTPHIVTLFTFLPCSLFYPVHFST